MEKLYNYFTYFRMDLRKRSLRSAPEEVTPKSSMDTPSVTSSENNESEHIDDGNEAGPAPKAVINEEAPIDQNEKPTMQGKKKKKLPKINKRNETKIKYDAAVEDWKNNKFNKLR